MTSLPGITAVAPSRFEPPQRSDDAPRDVAAAPPRGLMRRFLERFALIAFALYHLPLFLNNYPSLGGGGFNDTGLAVRWGHVFTPPGIWVAHHIFHIAGAMPNGYRGDNGDVAEEFGRLLLAVVIGVVAALWWTRAARRRPRAAWVPETLRVLLRYSIALGLASYAIAKLLPMQFPALRGAILEQRVGDLSPMSLLWTFMEYSRPYAFFGGLMEATAVVLLCFRRTATLGALTCLAVMVNVALLNYAYGVPVKLYSTMLVVSAGVLVLYDVPRLTAVFVRNAPAPAPRGASFIHERIPASWRWSIKLVLVGSVCVSSVTAMRSALASLADTTGLSGTWTVTSFSASHTSGVGAASGAPAAVPAWSRLVIDRFSVLIRTGSDSTIACGRRQTTPTDAQTLTLVCRGGVQGALHWTRAGDSLQITGTFGGAQASARAKRVDAPYPLLRSRFRLISE